MNGFLPTKFFLTFLTYSVSNNHFSSPYLTFTTVFSYFLLGFKANFLASALYIMMYQVSQYVQRKFSGSYPKSGLLFHFPLDNLNFHTFFSFSLVIPS